MSSSIDLVIITLICLKQKSRSVSFISVAEGANRQPEQQTVCCYDCLSILKNGVEVGDDVYPGVDLTFNWQRRSWSRPSDTYLQSSPSSASFPLLHSVAFLFLQGFSMTLTSPVSLKMKFSYLTDLITGLEAVYVWSWFHFLWAYSLYSQSLRNS